MPGWVFHWVSHVLRQIARVNRERKQRNKFLQYLVNH